MVPWTPLPERRLEHPGAAATHVAATVMLHHAVVTVEATAVMTVSAVGVRTQAETGAEHHCDDDDDACGDRDPRGDLGETALFTFGGDGRGRLRRRGQRFGGRHRSSRRLGFRRCIGHVSENVTAAQALIMNSL